MAADDVTSNIGRDRLRRNTEVFWNHQNTNTRKQITIGIKIVAASANVCPGLSLTNPGTGGGHELLSLILTSLIETLQ